MELVCNTKFWLFPASHFAQNKRLYFYMDDKLVYDLVMPLDYDNPEYEFPLNVERFQGKKIRIECNEDMEVQIKESNTRNDVFDGKYRPYAHFTAKRGWINDPNGLVYYNGQYHMFFQHNPVDCKWENMHWGHAVSNDLIHWKEKDIVFYPDEDGTVFSGSAIVDWKNVTGLKQNENDVILIYYTCAGSTSEASKGKPFTQNLAYSVDGGLTFKKYAHNPLIEQIVGGNRDPKVIYYEPDDSYIMAFYLDNHEYVLYKSTDLIHWSKIQSLYMEEDAECPDFFPLAVDGNHDNIKWVFIGASDRYYIGEFNGESYTNLSALMRLNYGNNSYAAQSWSDMPDGRRVRTAFSTVIIPGEPYASCMNVPQEMNLRMVNGETKLCVQPVKEIECLYTSHRQFNHVVISPTEPFKHTVWSKCCDITINARVSQSFLFKLYGFTMQYNSETAILKCLDKEVKVAGNNGNLSIRLLMDTVNTEVFTDDGSVFLGMTYIQDYNLNTLSVTAENSTGEIDVDVKEIKRYWE